jgi:hypothetical protein
MRNYFPCWEYGYPDCTCWFKSLSDLKTHLKHEHQKELVIVE